MSGRAGADLPGVALRERALIGEIPDPGTVAHATGVRVGVMEFMAGSGEGSGVASLVAYADGTTSLYFSTGGGIIGAGEHEPVRRTARRFLDAMAARLGAMRLTRSIPTPGAGIIRFYARTASGLFTADADEQAAVGEDPLSSVFLAGNEVLTAIRLHTPAGDRS